MAVERTAGSVLYYAGHGFLDEQADHGYWLPIDAERDSRRTGSRLLTSTSALQTFEPHAAGARASR